ncbi:MAG: metallophosphoesterase, partial [Candidatus Bathyarchaeia archaeon]
YAALISDLHVGSKMFMQSEFKRFILWLKGRFGGESARRIAGHVKYVIIAGDLVDGVGIYPQQIDELYIKDIYKQYQAVAELLQEIPEYIEVIIIPGNHDATRRALPQPAIERRYAEPMYEARRIHSLGDPSVVSLHGTNLLLYHGRSLDDVISLAPNMSFQEPEKAMTFLLRCRHLAPAYGMRTPIASGRKDHLVIESIPDVFHAGHVHMMKYSTYRGVLVVNSGAWQGQTEYQREMGHVPNPCIAPILNLQTLQVTTIDFRTSF